MEHLAQQLEGRGYVHVSGPISEQEYVALASRLGCIVQAEAIALRAGAHAYVARPGKVPLHTDQPEVAFIGWRCEQQDDADGASLLLDARAVAHSLTDAERSTLRRVELHCPPLRGGPPTERWPVLRHRDDSDDVFCSPWLRSASDDPDHQAALDGFRQSLKDAAERHLIEVRLRPGDALFIDNRRMLHGRRAIAPTSKRRLHRLWVS